jgi:hypothetical protein
MENEGIMALPQGAAMQDMPGPMAQGEPVKVSSADSYDAALTALRMTDPQEFEAFKQQIRASLEGVEIPPEQLDALVGILERLVETPEDYPEFARLAQGDGIEVPDEFDPEFVGALLVVLNEMRGMVAETMRDLTTVEPMVAGMEPARFAEGGLADVAAYLQAQGRGEDRVLAHITPGEAAMLERRGGAGTINPVTGLPEYGWLSKAWKSVTGAVKSVVKGVVNVVKKVVQSPVGRILGTIALATVLGPAGVGLSLGTAAGVASAGTTLLAGGSIKDALVAGAMGYVGGGGTIMGASPVSAIGQYLPGAAGSALNTGLATGAIGTGVGLVAGMKPADALRMGVMSGASAAALQGLQNSGVGRPDQAMRDEVFKRAMAGDEAAAQAIRSGDYSAFSQQAAPPASQGGNQGVGQVGQTGTTGTAQDLLTGRGLNIEKGSGIGLRAPLSMQPGYGTGSGDFSIAAGGTAPTTNYDLLPRGYEGTSGTGLQPPFVGRPSDFSVAAGGTAARTNYSLAPAAAAPASQPGIIDRAITGAKNLYNEYLSPSRPGLPADAGILQKYGPVALAGTAAVAAAGGMSSEPANPNPAFNRNYTGMDYIRDNPQLFQGGLDTSYQRPTTPNPVVVPTPSYASIPIGQPGVVQPGGITQQPGGVAQPYNVAGLYGVPLLYGQPPVPPGPPGYAKGGELRPTEFPRKTGPIDGPGTGTSDSIPAMLSDGEFVFTAKAVRNAGGGSRRKGAARMYKLMKKLEGGPVKAK